MVENSFNIIILDPYENFITFLNSNLVEITENCSTDSHRSIEIRYPLDNNEISEQYNEWFRHGNKVYIPSTLGMDNCLYVINTEYNLDFISENNVQVEAEEVLVELNYDDFASYEEDPLPITSENLETWFGDYYDIGEIDPLDATKNTVNPRGNMRKMEFLKLIESSTNRVFVTEYNHENNKITRTLHLKKESNLRQVAKTEYLDLNRNLQSLELIKDETNTYSAMAPVLKLNSKTTEESESESVGAIVAASTTLTSNNSLTLEDARNIYEAWLNLEVGYRDYIPMIVEKLEGSENFKFSAYWYAPFIKEKGKSYIYPPNTVNCDYNCIVPYKNNDGFVNPTVKKGFVETSETHPYAIYNVLANSLLEKTRSKFTLKVDVKDIQLLLGEDNLGYQIYETLYVRPPGFDYYVPCYITKTTKNPHLPGENKITLETDVIGTHFQEDTEILTDNIIITAEDTESHIGGQLISESGSPIPNATVSINIRLSEAYTSIGNIGKEILEFKPEDETYIFSDDEILRLEEKMRYASMTNSYENNFIMKTVTGKKYSVPIKWAIAIYNTRNQIYINSDNPVGMGKFKKSIQVHYYPDNYNLLLEDDNILYYPSRFYDIIQETEQDLGINSSERRGVSPIPSSEKQTGSDCVPAAMSNATAMFKMYKTENELRKIFGTNTSTGTPLENILPGILAMGLNYTIHDLTWENFRTYIIDNKYGVSKNIALLIVNPQKMGYSNTISNDTHAVIVSNWWIKDNKEYIQVLDSNKPIYDPSLTGTYDYIPSRSWYDFRTLLKATKITVQNNEIGLTNDDSSKSMIILSNTSKNLPNISLEEITNPGVFDPGIQTYVFDSHTVESAFLTLVNNIIDKPTIDVYSISYPVTDINNQKYSISGTWVLALGYECMFYYHDKFVIWTNLNVVCSLDETSGKYYKKLIQGSSYFTATNPTQKGGYAIEYVLSEILFRTGKLYPPLSVVPSELSTETQAINDSKGKNYNYICHAIEDINPQWKCYIVDYSITNIKKYTTYSDYNEAFSKSYVLLCLIGEESRIVSNYQNAHNGYFLITSHNSTNVMGQILLGRGSSPGYYPNSTPPNTPLIHKPFNSIGLDPSTTEKGSKMIVISRLTLDELEEEYLLRGQT